MLLVYNTNGPFLLSSRKFREHSKPKYELWICDNTGYRRQLLRLDIPYVVSLQLCESFFNSGDVLPKFPDLIFEKNTTHCR